MDEGDAFIVADGQLVHGNHILVVMVPDFLEVLRFAVGILGYRPAHLDVDLFIVKRKKVPAFDY